VIRIHREGILLAALALGTSSCYAKEPKAECKVEKIERLPIDLSQDPKTMAERYRHSGGIVLFILSGATDDIPHSSRYDNKIDQIDKLENFQKMLFPISSESDVFVNESCRLEKNRLMSFIRSWNDDMLRSLN